MSLASPDQLAIDGSPFAVGIVAARYNPELVGALLTQVLEHLSASGVKESKIRVERVPGSNELPVAAQLLLNVAPYDVVIALGLLIRGDTIHYELIADAATQALQSVAIQNCTPVINGVVVAENQQQAEARCRGSINRGAEFAHAALEMAALKRKLTE